MGNLATTVERAACQRRAWSKRGSWPVEYATPRCVHHAQARNTQDTDIPSLTTLHGSLLPQLPFGLSIQWSICASVCVRRWARA